ncbi:hypothetical protein H2200_013520 [Cladophialophora chaetospira]|uniref:Uncharacterized protein n=1 Tax=Cladophialophora chaetospira TaxID=386627 RepID=A0AA38WVZ3_9EURO|nr:hypothetical protein H2200_013520 [Cladophialophora chaetospira]
MCFRDDHDPSPPPRPADGRYDAKYVQALEQYADQQELRKAKQKKRRRNNGMIAAVSASAGASAGGGGGGC